MSSIVVYVIVLVSVVTAFDDAFGHYTHDRHVDSGGWRFESLMCLAKEHYYLSCSIA